MHQNVESVFARIVDEEHRLTREVESRVARLGEWAYGTREVCAHGLQERLVRSSRRMLGSNEQRGVWRAAHPYHIAERLEAVGGINL